jgi:4-amino-4-deoxy-L-arabinose transferase-like glycosyltransferase
MGFGDRTGKPDYKEKLILILLLTVFMMQAVFSMRQKSPTWDETRYFGLGYHLLKERKWDVPASTHHPPLPYYLNSFPFIFYPPDETAWDPPFSPKGEKFSNDSIYTAGLKLLTDRRYPQDRLLFLSRIPTIFIALLMGFYLWKWARELHGGFSAILALFLFTFCPNILAHSGLITPDVLHTCFTFISVYYLWKIANEGSWMNILLSSLFFGLTLLTKYTSVLLIPIFIILSIAILISRKEIKLPHQLPLKRYSMENGSVARWIRLGSLLSMIIMLGLFVFSLGYMFHYTPYLKGIIFHGQIEYKGNPSFLMGMNSYQGWWFFYLVAFAIKTPIPLLILLLLSFIFYKKNPHRDFLNLFFLIVPVFVYFLFFSAKLFCVGLRYILPIYPFLFVQAGMVAGIQFKRMRVVAYVFIAVLCFWHMTSSIGVYPHYLAYFNEAVGGPDKGYNYLVDSNLDWGQDLKGLGIYMKKKGIQKVHLSYFGTADPRYYGINYEWMPSFYLPEDHYDGDNRRRDFTFPDSGIVAISATNLQNVFFGDKTYYNWLKKYNPIDKIGYSIFIYDLDQQKESHR